MIDIPAIKPPGCDSHGFFMKLIRQKLRRVFFSCRDIAHLSEGTAVNYFVTRTLNLSRSGPWSHTVSDNSHHTATDTLPRVVAMLKVVNNLDVL